MFQEISDISDYFPDELLAVTYSVDGRKLGNRRAIGTNIACHVLFGNILQLRFVMNPPIYRFNAKSDSRYTLIMVDPDVISKGDRKSCCCIHWLVVNIPGNDLAKGKVIIPYMAPYPKLISNDDIHRYVLLMYQQPNRQKFLIPKQLLSNEIKNLRGFNLREFESDYQLDLVALNFFYCKRDRVKTSSDKLSLYRICLDPKLDKKRKMFR